MKTIKLEGEQGRVAFLGIWLATINESVPVERANRRRYDRLWDAVEALLERNGEGKEQTVGLKPGVDRLELEDGEYEYLNHRLKQVPSTSPRFVKQYIAAEDAVEAAE